MAALVPTVFVFSLAVLVSNPAVATPAFSPLTEDGFPNVQSAAAVVVDLESGDLLYEKNPGDVRAIASTGKLVVALVVRQLGLDLDATTTISDEDADQARGGARTRLLRGASFKNQDLLRAMLIASDNRAPSALGRAVGLSPEQLISAMNDFAAKIGLKNTRFTDCSGLNGNVSTAKEMAKVLALALADPVIGPILRTPSVEVVATAPRPQRILYRNTNRPIHSGRYDILGGKTGFTDEAGYCLVIAVRHAEKEIGMVFLGASEKLTRFGDFRRVFDWLSLAR